ncbi:hypothetical protein SAMN06265337_1501 [Hymenobacter gelipurpurascens]|uniref:DUF3575 domain-containing protein n=1 Tax=Hymenobacter gelipurpurascens TaxID=89968 RepID=A0A212TJ73_9BACT|nr:hypothetical protein [Hymenobacter gelipurpurascens]SNC66109.1 hypothetical protein SAMN06265337_1501 [Hymenobacter gelipurpurascens]
MNQLTPRTGNPFFDVSCPRAPRAVASLLGLLLTGGPAAGSAQVSASSPIGLPAPADSVGAPTPRLRHNVLKVSPVLFLGVLSVFYERALTDRVSVVVGFGAGGTNRDFGRTYEQGDFTFRRGTVEVRRYWKQGLRGFYAGPYLRVGTLRESYAYYLPPGPPGPVGWREQQARLWTPGVMLGHQLLTRWFALDTFLGLQSTRGGQAWVGANGVPEGMASSKLAVRVGLSIGVPF